MKLPSFLFKKSVRNDRVIYRLFRIPFIFKRKHKDINSCENRENAVITPLNLLVPPVKNIGRCSYMGRGGVIVSSDTKIGHFCSIGSNVQLGTGVHPTHMLSTSPFLYFDELAWKLEDAPAHSEYWNYDPIKIGNDVWIGDGVLVMNGVSIGHGAIIGSRAVVTKDVPPYAVVAGVPAKIIRYRFDDDIIKELLRLKWWDRPDEVIKRIPYQNVMEALCFLRKVDSEINNHGDEHEILL